MRSRVLAVQVTAVTLVVWLTVPTPAMAAAGPNYGKALADWLTSNLKPLWIVAVIIAAVSCLSPAIRKPAILAAMAVALVVSGLPIFAPTFVTHVPEQVGKVLDKAGSGG